MYSHCCAAITTSHLRTFPSSQTETVYPLNNNVLFPLPTVYFFYFLAMPRGIWDLSSPTRDWTRGPCIGILTTESPGKSLQFSFIWVHSIVEMAFFWILTQFKRTFPFIFKRFWGFPCRCHPSQSSLVLSGISVNSMLITSLKSHFVLHLLMPGPTIGSGALENISSSFKSQRKWTFRSKRVF